MEALAVAPAEMLAAAAVLRWEPSCPPPSSVEMCARRGKKVLRGGLAAPVRRNNPHDYTHTHLTAAGAGSSGNRNTCLCKLPPSAGRLPAPEVNERAGGQSAQVRPGGVRKLSYPPW